MEIIESRVILAIFCFIKILMGYGASAVNQPISRKMRNAVFIAELVIITAYIVYDNICYPPYSGWLLAIVGYVFVYAVMFMAWITYGIHSLLDVNTVYEMNVRKKVLFTDSAYLAGKTFISGIVNVKGKDVEVILPCQEFDALQTENKKVIKVKVKEIVVPNIIVTLA